MKQATSDISNGFFVAIGSAAAIGLLLWLSGLLPVKKPQPPTTGCGCGA